MQEEWKEIERFSRYKVNESGIVWDTEKDCKTPTTWNGNFLCTNLIRNDGVKVLCKIHRLVALSFIPNTENAHNVVHVDGDRSNNHYTNLKWKPKKVKEPVEKVVQKYQYKDSEYSISEISSISDVDEKTVYHRLRAGWSIGEILRNHKDFKGEGYQTDTHWFPTKKEMERYRIEKDKLIALQKKQERQKQKEDWLNRKKYGVGVFVNYPIQGIINRVTTDCYRIWDGMLARCYAPTKDSYANYGGRGVFVCDEWREFQNFAAWYQLQYKEKGWQLDKDILSLKEVAMYCPETCTFVPSVINNFYATLPKDGPSIVQIGNCFISQTSRNGKKIVRYYKSEQEAIAGYWEDKIETARLLALEYKGRVDERVVQVLMSLKPTENKQTF